MAILTHVREERGIPAGSASMSAAARYGIGAVEVALGYEWLVSGVNKVMNRSFASGIAPMLHDAMKGNPNGWWVMLTKQWVLPHLGLIAFLVEAGELLVALAFFVGALLWVSNRVAGHRYASHIGLAVGVTMMAALMMTFNYYLMAGNTMPGFNPDHAFDEGISIDGLMSMITGGLIVAHLVPALTSFCRSSGCTDEVVSEFPAFLEMDKNLSA